MSGGLGQPVQARPVQPAAGAARTRQQARCDDCLCLPCSHAAIADAVRRAGLTERTVVHVPPLPIQFGTHHRCRHPPPAAHCTSSCPACSCGHLNLLGCGPLSGGPTLGPSSLDCLPPRPASQQGIPGRVRAGPARHHLLSQRHLPRLQQQKPGWVLRRVAQQAWLAEPCGVAIFGWPLLLTRSTGLLECWPCRPVLAGLSSQG